jgi:hypothetical protein
MSKTPVCAPVSIDAHRAALEALFAPKVAAPVAPPSKRESAKMVRVPERDLGDKREAERAALAAKLVASEGRVAIGRVVDAFERAGLELPDEQETYVQLLEHADEARVRGALDALIRLLDNEAPKRRTVLESRVRRIEDGADEPATRELAAVARKKIARSRVL